MASAAGYYLLGLVCGYLTITVCESFFHRTIQHASPCLRRWHFRLGGVGRAMHDAWYSHHVVHHFRTFRRDHVTQFTDEGERAQLSRHLLESGHDHVIDCEFGIVLGSELRNYVVYMTPTLPVFVGVCWLGGAWFTAAACVPLIVWPMLAQFVHPHLHRSYDDVSRDDRASIRVMARTWYFRALAQHHWLHHQHPNCNYNLLLGGDWLLGVHRRASAADFERMREIGLWVGQRQVNEANCQHAAQHTSPQAVQKVHRGLLLF
jgi:hypothetical protein